MDYADGLRVVVFLVFGICLMDGILNSIRVNSENIFRSGIAFCFYVAHSYSPISFDVGI